MTKQVHLRRKEATSQHLPSKVVAGAKKTLASVLDNRNPLGIKDKEEEKRLISRLLNIDPTDRDYAEKVRNFWREFRVVVPSEGVVLNVGIDEDNNEPVNLEEYIIFRWAKDHPMVADSREKMESSYLKQFYIHDPEKELAKENVAVRNTRLAYKEFAKIAEDEDKMDMVLRILSQEDVSQMNATMKENRLDKIVKTNPSQFIKVATDPDLEIRSEIKQMVAKNILRKQGSSILYMDTTIGDSEAEAVSYFKNDRNSETVLDLRSRLKEVS